MSSTFDTVTASYDRCQLAGDFFDSFYARFLRKSPELAKMFSKTDFTRQKRMLKQSLFELIIYFRGIEDSAEEEIKKLATMHREMNVTLHHFELWLEALLETIAEFDPEINQDVTLAWREVMAPGLTAMRSEASATKDPETK